MLKRILIFYKKIIKSRIPKEDVELLNSMHVNFAEAKSAPPTSQEQRRLEPMRHPNWNVLGDNANLLADDPLDFRSAGIRKLRLYEMVLKLPAVKRTKSVMGMLISKGVEPLILDDDCWKLLLQEVPNGHRKVAEVLLSKGVDISAPDADGSHPLILAAYEGDADVVELLLDGGADISATGGIPLPVAVANDHPDVVQFLFSRGADLSVYSNGWNPLFFGCTQWTYGNGGATLKERC
jgi:hypothetical protein